MNKAFATKLVEFRGELLYVSRGEFRNSVLPFVSRAEGEALSEQRDALILIDGALLRRLQGEAMKRANLDGLDIPPFLRRKRTAESDEKVRQTVVAEQRRRAGLDIKNPSDCVRELSEAEQLWKEQEDAKKRIRLAELQERKEAKAQQEGRSIKKRAVRAGLIPVADVASKLNITAKEARGALRSCKFAKPDAGWAFTPEQAEAAEKAITAQLRKEDKCRAKKQSVSSKAPAASTTPKPKQSPPKKSAKKSKR